MQVYKISDEHSGLSILEQLYTARGAQGFACLKDFLEPESFNIDVSDYKDTVLFNTGWYNAIWPGQYQMRPLWTTKYEPKSIHAQGNWLLMNIPLVAFYA